MSDDITLRGQLPLYPKEDTFYLLLEPNFTTIPPNMDFGDSGITGLTSKDVVYAYCDSANPAHYYCSILPSVECGRFRKAEHDIAIRIAKDIAANDFNLYPPRPRFTITEIDVARMKLQEVPGYDHVLSLVSGYTAMDQRLHGHKIIRMEDVSVIGCNGPTHEQVGEIIEFGRALPDNANVLVHCHVGQSWSPAAVIIMLVARGATPQEAFDEVKAIRPILMPNMLMIRYGDELLGCGGELEKIVAEHTGRLIVPKEPVKVEPEAIDAMAKLMALDFGVVDDDPTLTRKDRVLFREMSWRQFL